uniref:Uncharacterized protein n=1 Tax=Rhizophora mucronata TaxID=61149 RepID=A0A2P2NCU0_RHIMU
MNIWGQTSLNVLCLIFWGYTVMGSLCNKYTDLFVREKDGEKMFYFFFFFL